MRNAKTFLVLLAAWACLVPAACAIDLDGGGISDVWEAYYATGPLQANEDPDTDGMTNIQEYYFNTNPLAWNPKPIQFILNVATQEIEFAFYTPPTQRFQMQRTEDLLQSWSDLGGIIVGDDTVYIYTESVTGIEKAFFRANPLGALDADSDLLDAFEENLIGTSDLTASSDTDSMPDGYEWANGLNPLVNDANGDKDNDGALNFQDARPNDNTKGLLDFAITYPAHGGSVN
jgi:clumping factor A